MVVSTSALYDVHDSQQSLLVTNRNEKYFLGDRKTFMQELEAKIDTITKELIDPNNDSMVIDGELIEDKNTPGAIYLINAKLNELKDINRTVVSTFDYLKEMEKEVARMVSA